VRAGEAGFGEEEVGGKHLWGGERRFYIRNGINMGVKLHFSIKDSSFFCF
jgi:hypothetical protein